MYLKSTLFSHFPTYKLQPWSKPLAHFGRNFCKSIWYPCFTEFYSPCIQLTWCSETMNQTFVSPQLKPFKGFKREKRKTHHCVFQELASCPLATYPCLPCTTFFLASYLLVVYPPFSKHTKRTFTFEPLH